MTKLNQSLCIACYALAAVVLGKLAGYVTPGAKWTEGVTTIAICAVCLAGVVKLTK